MALNLAAIFAAGGLGACLRFLLTRWVDGHLGATLPGAGTLAVNLLGSFLMGLLGGLIPPGPLRIALLTGLLGGFTTYSAFALLTVDLAHEGRWQVSVLQVLAHLLGGALCLLLGLLLARHLRA